MNMTTQGSKNTLNTLNPKASDKTQNMMIESSKDLNKDGTNELKNGVSFTMFNKIDKKKFSPYKHPLNAVSTSMTSSKDILFAGGGSNPKNV